MHVCVCMDLHLTGLNLEGEIAIVFVVRLLVVGVLVAPPDVDGLLDTEFWPVAHGTAFGFSKSLEST